MVPQKKIPAYLILAISVILTACRYTQVEKPAPAVNAVEAGSRFRITLPENHSKGQAWQLLDGYDTRVVRRLNDVWHGNEKGIDFNLEAASSGKTTLHFIQRQYNDTLTQVDYIVKISE